ncbi:5-hydroxytryptamine receptor 3A-like [Centropristis striata]|uniref:5-hydroxytryptamine receptor 3A-like n=1 Tax=Centropristis striata TaxID=184440 RepID=UPI0027E20F18|nr:5-hydroxytryptamine receptor 3A-like [Centropristis striata]
MMLAALLFLLSLTGGIASNLSVQPDLLDALLRSNYSFVGNGSASNYSVTTEPPDNLPTPDSRPQQNGRSFKRNCTPRAVIKHLNLLKQNENTMTRPGDNKSPTEIGLSVVLSAIVDVNEKDQKFVSYLWIDMIWKDEYVSWNPKEFCDIHEIYLPTKVLWVPDLTIEEMTQKDKAVLSPFVWVTSEGRIIHRTKMVVISSCKLEVYKFPFDVQSCNLSFKSIIHSDKHMKITQFFETALTRNASKKIMGAQSEWLFDNITTSNQTLDFGIKQSTLVYTITMKRRSVLYVANFLLPVMFFFCLDLASFLISDSRGEKLSFKVTVLLAVTVMQLILNEILPSSSDRIPLIAVYCIGIFGLMMISLFETILVMYLMGKDIEADEDQIPKSEDCEDKRSKVSSCCKEVKKWTHCARVCDVSVDEPPSELLSATKEGNSSELTEESIALEKVSDELKEVIQLLNSREEAGKLGYWTRVAKTINKVFFISYVTVASVFLVVMFSLWNSEAYK